MNLAQPVPPDRPGGVSWPLVVALLALLGVLVYIPPGFMLRDADTYWHMAAGRWILERMQVPQADPFSHTLPGVPWTAHEWLSEVVLHQIHRHGSWMGLLVMVGLAYGATLARLNRFLLHRMEPLHALLFTAFAAVMAMPHLLARPHILAWPLLMLWMAELVEACEARRTPAWWLCAVMVLWANLHGSFTLGLALLVPVAAEAVWRHEPGARAAAARRWGAFFVAALAASMLTPNGWHAILFTAHVMRLKFVLATVGEWLSPDFHGYQPLEVWLLLLMAMALRGHLRLDWIRAVVLLGLLHLALKHQRNVSMLGLLSPLLLARPWAEGWYAATAGGKDAEGLDRLFRRLALPLGRRATAIWLAAIAAAVVALVQWRPAAPDTSNTPEAAVNAALAAKPPGPVLNAYEFGGYLIYRGIPVYIDGRADMYGDDYFKNFVRAMRLNDPKALETILEKHRIGWTIFQPGTPALAVLDRMPGWKRLYGDSEAVVHLRVDGAKP